METWKKQSKNQKTLRKNLIKDFNLFLKQCDGLASRVEKTKRKNSSFAKTNIGKTSCAMCDSKKSRFIKEKEASWFWSNLVLITPLSKIPVLDDIFFKDVTWMKK